MGILTPFGFTIGVVAVWRMVSGFSAGGRLAVYYVDGWGRQRAHDVSGATRLGSIELTKDLDFKVRASAMMDTLAIGGRDGQSWSRTERVE